MKKNIIIGILALVSITSLLFGYMQYSRAKKQEAIATENMKFAREAEIRAEQSMKEAMNAETQAVIAYGEYAEALEQLKLAEAANKKSKATK